MRRDQALFLAVGIVLGLVAGLLFGVILSRPDVVGAGAAPSPAPTATPAPSMGGGSPADGTDPHAAGGMESVTAQLATLRDRLAKNPDDLEALIGTSQIYLQANMNDRAIEPLQRAVRLAGNNGPLLSNIAAMLAQAGDPKTALATAQKSMSADQRSPEPAELVANIALKSMADVETAASAIAEIRRRNAQYGALPALEQQLASTRAVLAAGRERPNDPQAQVALGNLLYDTHQWAASEAAYRRAEQLGGADANVLTDLGFVLSQQGKTEDALRHFDLALQKNPQQWQAALNGTVISLNAGQKDRARAWLERLKAINPQHPNIPGLEAQIAAR